MHEIIFPTHKVIVWWSDFLNAWKDIQGNIINTENVIWIRKI